jgi:hypothetical protein
MDLNWSTGVNPMRAGSQRPPPFTSSMPTAALNVVSPSRTWLPESLTGLPTATGSCSRHIPCTSSNAANSQFFIGSTPTGRVWSLSPASSDLSNERHSLGIPTTESGSSSPRPHQVVAPFQHCRRMEGKPWLSRRLARMEPGSRAPKEIAYATVRRPCCTDARTCGGSLRNALRDSAAA